MKISTISQISRLISDLTRLCGSRTPEARALRESPIARSFTPDSVIPNPFKDLPNTSRLWVRANRLDPLLAKHGISSKLEPEMAFSVLSWRVKAANRYLRIMHYRLSKLLKTARIAEYWVLALRLMQKSSVLRAVALRKFDLNWHRNYKFGSVKLWMCELESKITNLAEMPMIVRNYVSKIKPDGSQTYRPIGNPSYPDRMYLYLWQSFYMMFVSNFISRSQHAYLPGRGVPTALTELTTLLESDKFPFAWEFDLKGAFPSVNIPEAVKQFHSIGLPLKLAQFIERMSIKTIERVDLSPPDQYRLLAEPKFDRQVELSDALENKFVAHGDLWSFSASPISELSQLPNRYLDRKRVQLHAKYEIESTEIAELMEDDDWGFSRTVRGPMPTAAPPVKDSPDGHVGRNFLDKHAAVITSPALKDLPGPRIEIQGFPQGSGVSPILFNTVFEIAALRGHFSKLHPSVKVLSYADDFIVFSKVDLSDSIWEESAEMKASGLQINREKSRLIRSNGEFVVPSVKYLGATFHLPQGDRTQILVEGTPRSGVKLMFDKEHMIGAFKFRDQQLSKFAKALDKDNPLYPDKVLDLWSKGVAPFSLIPYSVMEGQAKLESSTIKEILSVSDSDSSAMARTQFPSSSHLTDQQILDWAKTQPDFGEDSSASLNPHMSQRALRSEYFLRSLGDVPKMKGSSSGPAPHRMASDENRMKSGKAFRKATEFLNTRLKGLLINRLHAGSWNPPQEMASRSLESPKKTQGRSWLELKTRTAEANLHRFSMLSSAEKHAVLDNPAVIRAFSEARKDASSKGWHLTPREFLDNISIYNSTSLATVDFLRYLKNPRSVKISNKGQLIYK
jgi:hypothetical protein